MCFTSSLKSCLYLVPHKILGNSTFARPQGVCCARAAGLGMPTRFDGMYLQLAFGIGLQLTEYNPTCYPLFFFVPSFFFFSRTGKKKEEEEETRKRRKERRREVLRFTVWTRQIDFANFEKTLVYPANPPCFSILYHRIPLPTSDLLLVPRSTRVVVSPYHNHCSLSQRFLSNPICPDDLHK